MFRILDQDEHYAIIKCDRQILDLIEDLYDSQASTYENLDQDLDPQEVLHFIRSCQDNGQSTTEIHSQVSI